MSLTSARSDCAVSGVVLRGTQRASSPRPYHDQRVVETSTFSGVSLNSLKTLLVLSHRRVLRPSLQLAWRISGSPNLTIASRNVLRQSSRPHRYALQRFTSNRVWAAVLATTTSLRIFLQVLMQGGPGQVRSTSSFRVILHDPRSIHYIQERFLLRHRLWVASTGIASWPCRRVLWPSDPESLRSLVHESCFHFELEHCTGWNQPQLSASSSRVIPDRGFRVFPVAPPPECDLARPLTVLHHQARAHCREIDSYVSSLCLRRRALLQRWRHGLHPSSTIETRTGLSQL